MRSLFKTCFTGQQRGHRTLRSSTIFLSFLLSISMFTACSTKSPPPPPPPPPPPKTPLPPVPKADQINEIDPNADPSALPQPEQRS